jgi:ankyrin repeat protein
MSRRILIAFLLASCSSMSSAQSPTRPPEQVREIVGEVRDDADINRRVPLPFEVTVDPCGRADVDSRGTFRARCANLFVDQQITISARKAGWQSDPVVLKAPAGGFVGDPVRMRKQSPPQPGAAGRSLVTMTANLADTPNGPRLTMTVRNLTGNAILLDDLVIRIEKVYEIRQPIQALPTDPEAPSAKQAVTLHSSQSAPYEIRARIGQPLPSPAYMDPLIFQLTDDSKRADHDFIYLARIGVGWQRQGGQPQEPPPAFADGAFLLMVGGRRRGLEVRSTTQTQVDAALAWDREQIRQVVSLIGRRTQGVDALIARLDRFAPRDVHPDVSFAQPVDANVDTVRTLLVAGADGITGLMVSAAQAAKWDVVSFLIELGPVPAAAPQPDALINPIHYGPGDTVLHLAASAGNVDIVLKLLNNRGNPGVGLRGGAERGHLDVVEAALDAKADPNSVDLCAAVLGRNIDVLKLLLARGATIGARNEPGGMYDCMPTAAAHPEYDRSAFGSALSLAARTLQEDMLRALLNKVTQEESTQHALLGNLVRGEIDDAAAKIPRALRDSTLAKIRPVVALLLKCGADVRLIGGKALASDAEIARMLITAGADITTEPSSLGGDADLRRYNRDGDGIFPAPGRGSQFDLRNGTALLYAAREDVCDLALVKTLREVGARPVGFRLMRYQRDTVAEMLDRYLSSPNPSDLEQIECLTLAGADLSAPIGFMEHPALIAAAVASDVALARLLLENGVDVNMKAKGKFALLAAVDQMPKPVSVELVRLLLDHKADPNLTANGRSGLVTTLEQDPVPMQVLKLIVGAGGRFNLSGFDFLDMNPLTKCVAQGDTDCVRWLLEPDHRIDPRARDKAGRSAYDYPTSREVMDVLRDATRR